MADRLRADGGVPAESGSGEEQCGCENLSGFPCWPVEALTKALKTDEVDEKDYQIREALQLLALETE